MNESLRAYFFGNMYLSSIQQGIQAAHVVHQMFTDHDEERTCVKLWEWARFHKTMVLLNGGYQSELEIIYEFLVNKLTDLGYPVSYFREEDASLNNALTSVGCVLPESIYDAQLHIGKKVIHESESRTATLKDVILTDEAYRNWEIKSFISKYGLAS